MKTGQKVSEPPSSLDMFHVRGMNDYVSIPVFDMCILEMGPVVDISNYQIISNYYCVHSPLYLCEFHEHKRRK